MVPADYLQQIFVQLRQLRVMMKVRDLQVIERGTVPQLFQVIVYFSESPYISAYALYITGSCVSLRQYAGPSRSPPDDS